MRRLLLTSAGFENKRIGDEFLRLVNKEPANIKVLFIPTASRTEEELYYVGLCIDELIEMGIKIENIITYNLDYNIEYNEVRGIDSIYVCGGNTYYLLSKVREANFEKVLDRLIDKGKLYLGVSAGSVVAGPNIGISSSENDVGLNDLTGLKLTNLVVAPHYCPEKVEKVEKFKNETDYTIYPLTDEQALLIIDDKIEIIQ